MTVHIVRQPVSADLLARRLSESLQSPVAVVTMGNPTRGDDGAALRIADRLFERLGPLLFNVETAPESFLMPLSRCCARSCLLIDAINARAEPGDVVLLEPDDLQHTDFTTHGLSPKAFMQAVRQLSAMRLLVLGIQAGSVRQGDALSPAVNRAVDCVADALELVIDGNPSGGTDESRSR